VIANPARSAAEPQLSVVVPAHDEEGNILLLVRGLREALDGIDHEILLVDDVSMDGTRAEMLAARAENPRVRIITRTVRGGKTGALNSGFEAARGRLLATIDADLQNDPTDVRRCVDALTPGIDAVNGRRDRKEDTPFRYLQSRIGNGARRWLMGGSVQDAGTGIRVFRRECLAGVLLPFEGMHRYFGELAEMNGFKVVEIGIAQRPRHAGVAKYGFGNRAFRGVADILAVLWMKRRLLRGGWQELGP
jgi:glycosyltransferase involved in cell wall biosynthesis